jgi:hypothetical protein
MFATLMSLRLNSYRRLRMTSGAPGRSGSASLKPLPGSGAGWTPGRSTRFADLIHADLIHAVLSQVRPGVTTAGTLSKASCQLDAAVNSRAQVAGRRPAGRIQPWLDSRARHEPKVLAQGDELIVNDQLATTHRTPNGYPIVGRDAGRVHPDPDIGAGRRADPGDLRRNCYVAERQPHRPGCAPIPGAATRTGRARDHERNGRFDGANGTVAVRFTKDFKVLTITLK